MPFLPPNQQRQSTEGKKTGHQSLKNKNLKNHRSQYFENHTKTFLQSSFKMLCQIGGTAQRCKHTNPYYTFIPALPIPVPKLESYSHSHGMPIPTGNPMVIPCELALMAAGRQERRKAYACPLSPDSLFHNRWKKTIERNG